MPKNNNLSPFVSSLLDSFVPNHIRANYPNLVEFISAYLDYLENVHGSGYYQNAIPEQRNIDLQEEQFLRRIEQEIGLFIPREYEATPRLFYKKISDLWAAKGSTEAIETFFRLFLNDTVQIRYPWDSVLKPSDGTWNEPSKLRVSIIRGDGYDFVSKNIRQVEEYGVANVTRVEKKEYADQIIYELTIFKSQIYGEFKVGNRIVTEDQELEAEIYNSVTSLNVLSPGAGYKVGDRIRLIGRSRITFEGRVTTTDNSGGISSVQVIDAGSGTTPNHIYNVQGSGRYFFDQFKIFQYVDGNRTLALGDNVDIASDSITGFSQDYAEDLYFFGSYAGDLKFNESSNNLISNPLNSSSITSAPSDPTDPLNFKVESVNGTGATFDLSFGSIIQSPGRYNDKKGQLSDANVLQDSYFYQKFSYEVITGYTISDWIAPLKAQVHPAGTKPFSLVNRTDKLDSETHIFSDDVLELVPVHKVRTPEKYVNDFGKSLADSFGTTDQVSTSLEKPRFDRASVSESLVISKQDYVNGSYFASDYVGASASY